jgi:prepilin-type N-terminal cleavage/methylation domain-containing protein
MKYRNSGHNRGFTLAELLVASILLSIVMTSVYTLFHSAIGTWRAVEKDYDAYQDARNALTLLKRETGNILGNAGYLFEGEEDRFTMFTVDEPMNIEESEGRHLLRVEYSFNRNKMELIREEALVETALPQAPPKDRELNRQRIKLKKREEFVIATNVLDFQVRYIWIPIEIQPDSLLNTPPPPVVPVVVAKHKERWGLPQGLQVTLVVADPNSPEPLQFSVILPIRAPNYPRPRTGPNSLEEIFGGMV